jgi:hypothetical protein
MIQNEGKMHREHLDQIRLDHNLIRRRRQTSRTIRAKLGTGCLAKTSKNPANSSTFRLMALPPAR